MLDARQPDAQSRTAAEATAPCTRGASLADAVAAELARLPGDAARLVAVYGNGDVVRLRGLVGSYAARQAAVDAAFRAGARGVVNDIEVRRDHDAAQEDARLTGQILAKLRTDLHVPDEHLRVCVRDGAVTLSGSVPLAYQRDAAESLTRRTVGVQHVVNAITLAS
jgi:osmotically-inducible protein OsmY